MIALVGPDSVIYSTLTELEVSLSGIVSNDGISLLPVINAETLTALQWATGKVLTAFSTFANCMDLQYTTMADLPMNFA